MTNSVLLVGDMINDLVNLDGPTPYQDELLRTKVVENMAGAIDKARAADCRIIFIRIGFSADYRECPPRSPLFQGAKKAGRFQLGTWGTEVHPLLKPQPADFDVVKHRVSPFYGTKLQPILRGLGAERIFVGGVSTGGVVMSAAKEGHDRDYQITVLEDCCCAGSAEEQKVLIANMQRFSEVVSSNAVKFD